MEYRFLLTYVPTDSAESAERECSPIYGDDLSVVIERASGEWYYTRRLDGDLTFVRSDYSYIMSCAIDGSFRLTVECSNDNSVWIEYFVGTFSRFNLAIDEDNKTAILSGLSEDVYNIIEEGRKTEYDLMKIMPASAFKEVQGEIHPALALVDWRKENIDTSDVYCNGASTMGGYTSGVSGWSETARAGVVPEWSFQGVFGEALVTLSDANSPANGIYTGELTYMPLTSGGRVRTMPIGTLTNNNGCTIRLSAEGVSVDYMMRVYNQDGLYVDGGRIKSLYDYEYYTPASLVIQNDITNTTVNTVFHYIRATRLTASQEGAAANVLSTGPYYKGMLMFTGGGLTIGISRDTTDTANGHRQVPDSDGLYFAPPDDTGWHPLAEDEWNYGSLWYKVVPSVANGLLDAQLVGCHSWPRCWTLGSILKHLLAKISGGKVAFEENAFYSEFLYNDVNPVGGGEPFEWLFTAKSNVMSPSGSATRCPVTLGWFLELMRNAFNLYWWLEKRNDGKYDFRVEHVEYFRRGRRYDGEMEAQTDIRAIKPYRNFRREGVAVKRLSDQTNKYTFDLSDIAERYTFAWQGDGGSDEFKGWPMLFRAGWIEEGTSENHEVDNIFADLSWLTLNAGTDTASSKNYDGLFLFAGYRNAGGVAYTENGGLNSATLLLSEGTHIVVDCDIWLTMPQGYVASLVLSDGTDSEVLRTYASTGEPQCISILVDELYISGSRTLTLVFGQGWWQAVTIHRVHAHSGNLYRVPNTESRLTSGMMLQNGPLAWPSLQNEYLHYDVPARQWSYDSDEVTTATFLSTGTVKMIKQQEISVLPVLTVTAERNLTGGIRTGVGVGVLKTATVNLGSRNAETELDMGIE